MVVISWATLDCAPPINQLKSIPVQNRVLAGIHLVGVNGIIFIHLNYAVPAVIGTPAAADMRIKKMEQFAGVPRSVEIVIVPVKHGFYVWVSMQQANGVGAV